MEYLQYHKDNTLILYAETSFVCRNSSYLQPDLGKLTLILPDMLLRPFILHAFTQEPASTSLMDSRSILLIELLEKAGLDGL